MTRPAAVAGCKILLLMVLFSWPRAAMAELRSLFPVPERSFFEKAIAAEKPATIPTGVTGITVPHHLLAADLIARGFWAASAGGYTRVILLSPDHYKVVRGPFATTAAGLNTPFGHINTDRASAEALLARPDFEQHPDPNVEHGLSGVAPFVKAFFPEAEILPIVASIYSREPDWQAAIDALAPMIDERTLIVQSTDFSHYLPIHLAIQRDQEVLSILAAADPAPIADLMQPDHMDSKAAQYIQSGVQTRLGAQGVVVANRNSAEYGTDPRSTTSYVTTVYLEDPALGSKLRFDDQSVFYFAGDTLLGRYFQPALTKADIRADLADSVTRITAGAPLIVNLEGVIVDEVPIGLAGNQHFMLREIALPMLDALNVTAAGLANNHAYDLGHGGLASTQSALRNAGIAPLGNRTVHDLGAFRLLPINFVGDRIGAQPVIRQQSDLNFVCSTNADPPLMAFVHWGVEYTSEASAFERDMANRLAACGVTLVVGAHSHQHAPAPEIVRGGESALVFSLGNFLFDQRGASKSGALLELRVFDQGTLSSRLIPIPNYFEQAAP